MDNAQNEFQKFQSFIFMETASERGNKESSDRLRRYYSKGKHTLKDSVKAEYYLLKGCSQGENDCLTAYCRRIGKDPEYKAKLDVFRSQIEGANGSAVMVLAQVYKHNGDEEGYLHYLIRSARQGYTGAISKWLDILISNEPYDIQHIEEIEQMSIKRQLSVSYRLADFYHDHPDIFPGKLDSYIDALESVGSLYADELRAKYHRCLFRL